MHPTYWLLLDNLLPWWMMHHTSCKVHHASCILLNAEQIIHVSNILVSTRSSSNLWIKFWSIMQDASLNMQDASLNMQDASFIMKDASCIIQDLSCIMHLAKCIRHHAWSPYIGYYQVIFKLDYDILDHHASCLFYHAWCMINDASCMINDAWCSKISFTSLKIT